MLGSEIIFKVTSSNGRNGKEVSKKGDMLHSNNTNARTIKNGRTNSIAVSVNNERKSPESLGQETGAKMLPPKGPQGAQST